jgi:hypothetical protein
MYGGLEVLVDLENLFDCLLFVPFCGGLESTYGLRQEEGR